MKVKKVGAVEMKRELQEEAERKLFGLSEKEQLEFLAKKFGHLSRSKKTTHAA